MKPPAVYPSINRVAAHFAKFGIAKSAMNLVDGYDYRSIDDVVAAVSPLLAKHRLCMLPKVVERVASSRRSVEGEMLQHVSLRVAFTISSARDGSDHVVETFGEALDAGDKATAKAMSAAYKSAMIQVFCIPVRGTEDVDATSHRLSMTEHLPEPVEGWEQWAAGISDTVRVCESEEALTLVQERQRMLLGALSRERPELYRAVGEAFGKRRAALKQRAAPAPATVRSGIAPGPRRRSKELADA